MTPDTPHDLDLSRPTRELVFEVATRLLAEGQKPAVSNVRTILGKGSNLTIQSALNDWWQDLGRRINALYRHPTLPDSVASAAMDLWAAALKEADLANVKYRQDADARVIEAEARARSAEESLKQSEDARQTVMGELDSARATIDGLDRTLAAEVAHKDALAKQVDELNRQAREAKQEAETARKEAGDEVARIHREATEEVRLARSCAAEEIERARKEFHDQLALAQERFEAVEKRMLMEIDRERQHSAAARDAAQKEIERIRGDADLEMVRLRQRNSDLTSRNSELTAHLSKLEGQVEETSRQRDRIFAELTAALSKPAAQGGRKRKRRPSRAIPDNLAKVSDARREKNAPIFEEHLAEITARLDAGEKPSEVAAWLNTMGFEGNGATLNGLLKKAGLW